MNAERKKKIFKDIAKVITSALLNVAIVIIY